MVYFYVGWILLLSDCSAERCDESEGVERLMLASLAACTTDVRSAAARHLVFCGVGSAIAGEKNALLVQRCLLNAVTAGLPDAICNRAILQASVDPHYSTVHATVTAMLGGTLRQLISPFPGPHKVWLGAAAFVSLQVSDLQRCEHLAAVTRFFLSPAKRSSPNCRI